MRDFIAFVIGLIVGAVGPTLLTHLLYWLLIAFIIGYKFVCH